LVRNGLGALALGDQDVAQPAVRQRIAGLKANGLAEAIPSIVGLFLLGEGDA
jgi:hypothetical protein